MLLLALLGCPAVNYYYPEMGSNDLTWRPSGVSEDTSGSGGTDDSGGEWDGLTQVQELDADDAPLCALTDDSSSFQTFVITNQSGASLVVNAVNAACVETPKTSAAQSQVAVINGYVGGAYVVRDQDTWEPLYAILLGTDGGGLVVK